MTPARALTYDQVRLLVQRAWRCTCWVGKKEEVSHPVPEFEAFMEGLDRPALRVARLTSARRSGKTSAMVELLKDAGIEIVEVAR